MTTIQRCNPRNIDIAGIPFRTIVLGGLFQSQLAEQIVRLFDLRNGRVFNIHVEGNDLDAGVQGALSGFLHGFRQAVLDDNAIDTKGDGLIDHVGLQCGILAAVEHAQINTECRCLLLNARKIGLEEVAGGEITHQRDLHVAGIVQRCRHVGSLRKAGGKGDGCGRKAGEQCQCFSTYNFHTVFLR